MAVLLSSQSGCEGAPPQPRDQALVETILDDAPKPSAEMASTALLTRVDVYGTDDADAVGVRVVLSFEGAPLFRQQQLPPDGVLPARITIELEGTTWADTVPVSQRIARGGLERVRLATPRPRVVLDLQSGASARVFYLTDPYRIVIDVSAATRATTKRRPLIVLDPGHGGSEPGAANARYGLVESQLALELAELAAKRLREILPDARVLLTRSSDVHLMLEERSALANAMEADVFVSIHFNASSEAVRKGGVTTFVLDTTNDRQALRLAARENGTRVSEVTGIQALLAKHHRKGQARGSVRLADEIQRHTLEGGRRVVPELANRGVRKAMFYVLVGARMPAVLLEASFLTHDPEARALATRRYRGALADGVASGIACFLRDR